MVLFVTWKNVVYGSGNRQSGLTNALQITKLLLSGHVVNLSWILDCLNYIHLFEGGSDNFGHVNPTAVMLMYHEVVIMLRIPPEYNTTRVYFTLSESPDPSSDACTVTPREHQAIP